MLSYLKPICEKCIPKEKDTTDMCVCVGLFEHCVRKSFAVLEMRKFQSLIYLKIYLYI